jgi:hypothetical protein
MDNNYHFRLFLGAAKQPTSTRKQMPKQELYVKPPTEDVKPPTEDVKPPTEDVKPPRQMRSLTPSEFLQLALNHHKRYIK